MDRRALLSLLGTAGVGGLAGFSTATSRTPEVASSSIQAIDRRCRDAPDESATITLSSDDGTHVRIDGSIAVPRVADGLSVIALNGVGKRDRDDTDLEVRIDFSPADSPPNTDLPECEGAIAYDADVEFTHPPTDVTVRHTVEEAGSFTLKPMATRTITR